MLLRQTSVRDCLTNVRMFSKIMNPKIFETILYSENKQRSVKYCNACNHSKNKETIATESDLRTRY